MDIITLEQNLKCPICWNIPEEPFESSCCGHIFCHPCTKQIIEKKCPICRNTSMNFRKNFLAKKLLEEIKIKCHYGCDEQIKINKMKEHRYECRAALFKCTIEFCAYTGNRTQLAEHLIKEHVIQVMIISEQYDQLKSIFDMLDVKKSVSVKKKMNMNDFNLKMNYNYSNEDDEIHDSWNKSDLFDEFR